MYAYCILRGQIKGFNAFIITILFEVELWWFIEC